MRKRLLPVLLFLSVPFSLWLLHFSGIPRGIPGEWAWQSLSWEPMQNVWLGFALAGLAGIVYLTVAFIGLLHFPETSLLKKAAWLSLLTVCSFFWVSLLQEGAPQFQSAKIPFVVYYPASSGYFFKARYQVRDDYEKFLTDYEEESTKGDVLHEGTHPPGLYLFHGGCISFCNAFPAFTNWLVSTWPASAEEAFSFITSHPLRGTEPLTKSDTAAIWLSAMLTQFFCVASVIPLYLLLRRHWNAEQAWKTILFWPLVPAIAIFLPKSDALYPFMGILFLTCWMYAWDSHSWWMSIIAGLLFCAGLFFSLALLPVGLLAVLLTAWEFWTKRTESVLQPAEFRATLFCVGYAIVGFLIPIIFFRVMYNHNLFNVWFWNYKNHAGFYEQYPRTWWKWLLVNPVELAFALGLPISIAIVGGWWHQLRHPRSWRVHVPNLGALLCCLFVWSLLWVSGKNMGEAARLWLVFEIWFVWMLVYSPLLQPAIPQGSQHSTNQPEVGLGAHANWCWLLVCQMLAAVVTVMSVSGFDFNQG